MFVGHPVVDYIRGKVDETNWAWDLDETTHIELTKLIKNIGYSSFKCLWYRHPKFNLRKGLRPLNCDKDVLKFLKDVKDVVIVDLFVEHLIDTPIFGEEYNGDKVEEVVVEGD
ncbi:hypothetical protein SESBI_24792 [Sesbania bispinosa]|nr:hypothetical protein SESBI_24792 [Sesbania bispinosa]